MSHLVSQVSDAVQITDLDLLGKACAKLGLKLDTTKKVAHYYGSSTAVCDAVITLPGKETEIAVKKKADGTYGIEVDHYFAAATKLVGKNSDSLFQRYRAEELIKQARYDRWSVASETFNSATNELELRFKR